MTSSTTTTERPFIPLFRCDFNSACFANDQLIRTNGSEFNPAPSPNGLEPPRAPTSDVTSITTPTSNNEKCKLPYSLSLDDNMNNTYSDMRFCYNNTCETVNGDIGICAPGLYGLVSLNSSESSKTIIDSIDYNPTLRDSVGEQCLRFYYYFTIYDEEDWGQQIEVWIRPNNQSDNAVLIGNPTIFDMKENGWQFQNITFNSTFSRYTLAFSFIVGKENRTEDPTSNRTVYFALDNIELYDFNCSYVNNQLNPPTTTPVTVTTTISTSTTTTSSLSTTATTSAPPKQNLGLILGLSLGLGIPFVLGVLIGFIYCFKVYRPKHRVNPNTVANTNNTTVTAVTDIPLKPTKTKRKKNTKSSEAV
ncbi:unnamed protein product [Rotaria sordida]|uniref:MAM domain-containing protein n=1 Tax=Rotaria sordida TaxID=392033 RepID=A0A818S559_9BILA|nr:unnamed protein product [Rotaria sordida]